MNTQEAIEELRKNSWEYENRYFRHELVIYLEDAQEIISQIHEPKKVLIPRFVAEWIEEHKKENWWLSSAFLERENNQLREWLVLCDMDTRIHHQDIFARAWLDGYEIEQEKLYIVQIPDPNADGYSIVLGRSEGKVQIKQTLSTTWEMNCSNQLTEAEIKQDFEWAWNAKFAKEVG